MKFILGMEMRYGQKKTPINFGGGQWSWGVTVGLTLKSLLSRYLELGNLCKVHTWHGDAFWSKEKKPINFGGGQRSWGVTEGQTLKTSLTRYLELGNLDEVHTWYGDVLKS